MKILSARRSAATPKLQTLIAGVIASALITAACGSAAVSSVAKPLGPPPWSVVFLDNNQVYFGHITAVTTQEIELANVYMLHRQSPLGSGNASGPDQLSVECSSPTTTLKMQDVMNRQQLQPASFVVQRLNNLRCGPTVTKTSYTPPPPPSAGQARKVWSAVFLNDNEIFFGHIKSVNAQELDLINVFYLQRSPAGSGSPTQLTINSLVSSQIQCPTDEIIVNHHAMLYRQDLNNGSFVVSRLNVLSTQPAACFYPSQASPTPPSPAGLS